MRPVALWIVLLSPSHRMGPLPRPNGSGLTDSRVERFDIHGKRDRLVPLSGGRATARAIPGSRLLIIDGMGHDIPRGAWPRMLDAIEQNAARAGTPVAAR